MKAAPALRWLYLVLAVLLAAVGIPLALFGAVALFFEAGSLLQGEVLSAKEGFGILLLIASYFLLKWMVAAWLRFRRKATPEDLT
jgi:hypothetical protein